MPSRNVVKPHIQNAWYHLYNRGINKQSIFLDPTDYYYFIKILKKYLSPELSHNPQTGLIDPLNLAGTIDLVCFTLMPNHFHFLVKQNHANGITQLTQRILTAYVKYFNGKYMRIGPLFEGKLKGIIVDTDTYLLYLSRYIHRNHINVYPDTRIEDYDYSSYAYYMGKKHANWLKIDYILQYFYSKNATQTSLRSTYKEFVEYENSDVDKLVEQIQLE